MICKGCADTAKLNREEHDIDSENAPYYYEGHPLGCGCDCQHEDPREWSAMFAVERPNVD